MNKSDLARQWVGMGRTEPRAPAHHRPLKGIAKWNSLSTSERERKLLKAVAVVVGLMLTAVVVAIGSDVPR
jgi:hypothetical protein